MGFTQPVERAFFGGLSLCKNEYRNEYSWKTGFGDGEGSRSPFTALRFRVFAPQVALNREKGDIAFSP